MSNIFFQGKGNLYGVQNILEFRELIWNINKGYSKNINHVNETSLEYAHYSIATQKNKTFISNGLYLYKEATPWDFDVRLVSCQMQNDAWIHVKRIRICQGGHKLQHPPAMPNLASAVTNPSSAPKYCIQIPQQNTCHKTSQENQEERKNLRFD